MPSIAFPQRLLAACLYLSGVAFAKPVIHVADSTGGDAFVVSDYAVAVAPETAEIKLALSEHDAQRLAELSKQRPDARLIVAIGGTEAALPVWRDVPPGRELKLAFADPTAFAAVRAALAT